MTEVEVTMTQYGTLKSSNLASFDADISGSDARLRVTPLSNSSTTINIHRVLVEDKTSLYQPKRGTSVLFWSTNLINSITQEISLWQQNLNFMQTQD